MHDHQVVENETGVSSNAVSLWHDIERFVNGGAASFLLGPCPTIR